jgi:hypothetical protein
MTTSDIAMISGTVPACHLLPVALNQFVAKYFEQVADSENVTARPVRSSSMLKAIVNRIDNVNLVDALRRKLMDHLLRDSQLIGALDTYALERLLVVLNDEERERFDQTTRSLAFDRRFSRFAFGLPKLFRKSGPPEWLAEAIEVQTARSWQ